MAPHLFPAATWAQPRPLSTNSPYLLLKGGEGCPPTLSATKPLLLHGRLPTLRPVRALTFEWRCHPGTQLRD